MTTPPQPELHITLHTEASAPVLEQLASLDGRIFPEPIHAEDYARQLRGRSDVSILVASFDGAPAGFKVGYGDPDPRRFYSFSGGVVPEHRRRGIARSLMQRQHLLARERGYEVVFTRTKNKYRAMLILNLVAGFDVVGFHAKIGERFPTILLEKPL